MLETGTKAPDFTLCDQNGQEVKLSDYLGKKVILYFYPKDNTAGCTKQACGYSEKIEDFHVENCEVIGISKDTVASHKRFEEKPVFRSYHYISLEVIPLFLIKNTDFFSVFDFFCLFFML